MTESYVFNSEFEADAGSVYELKGLASARVPAEVLSRAVQCHEMWLGSGWELGARADLHGLDLHRVGLSGVILENADLHEADLHRALLGNADLEGADLHRADLHGADLHGAELGWADLREADLHGADLSGGSLHDADLRDADCHGADLTEADLTEADLRGADLRGARGLTRAQIVAARIDARTKLPLSRNWQVRDMPPEQAVMRRA